MPLLVSLNLLTLSSMLLYRNLPSSFSPQPNSTQRTFSFSPKTLSKPLIYQHIDMAKIGKLTKLKSAIKRWPSFTKLARTKSSIAASNDQSDNKIASELQAVYVGKSRRRYLLSCDTICHPLFQELIERSGGFDDGEVVVACEVVLFEHLLWMLESGGSQLGSAEELAEFYYTS
ncbi:auxin-responsive protein SAUR78 [Hevea brasiliensis]|nr:auxin-responsive protein SAUR78 [Hevea brasiliensis]